MGKTSKNHCSLDQFEDLLQYLSPMRNTSIRSVRVALAIYLTKFRLGLSNSVLASMFHLSYRRSVSRIIHSVRKTMMETFVPDYIGFRHIDRRTIIEQHSSAIANDLLLDSNDQIAVVVDGTYLYVQKSTNNEFQRRSYSMHKYRNLVKVIEFFVKTEFKMNLIVADGYYID